MPYGNPVKEGNGYVLPKKEGGFHSTKSGRKVLFKSKAAAKAAARAIMASEHGWKPSR